ncbi:unnamed protein product [Linum trigynum]|uniref:GOLD domain-containing protein n=1 Tax=Linum trigynum TaxID=586398 RepID=A0AAV2EC12_9ROSI
MVGPAANYRSSTYSNGYELPVKKNISTLVLLVAGLLLGFGRRVSSLAITVETKECVYESVMYEGDTVSGNYVVIDHEIFWGTDHPGIDFTATSPEGKVVESHKGKAGEKFEFKAPKAGVYKFCFYNPTTAPESVSFYIHVGHIPNASEVAKDEHMDPLSIKIAKLREALASVMADQIYLKARDVQHRHMNESTRRRVVVFTISEYLALTAASSLQVIYIRRMFSKSFTYNRV